MSSPLLTRGPRRIPADPELRLRDERLESLKAVVGKLAHDFNNFLVPQFGYLTLLKEELPAGSQAALYAGTMETAGRKSESYIESILLGMRPHRQFAPQNFEFHTLLQKTLEAWTTEGTGTAEVAVHAEIEPCTFYGDEKQWRNAINHLLSNARYALAMGGKLEATLRREAISGEEVLRLGLGTDEVFRLRIHDTGFGLSPEVAQRAFEPFFTTRTQIKAAGLGLTIVHSVTQFHGGQVELATTEDVGTTVTVWLPASGGGQRERLASVGGTLRPAARKRKKILLVEDDPLMKEVLRTWLAGFDFDTEAATTVEEARKSLNRAHTEWVLIISEVDLRSGPGEEIYRNIREIKPEVPWIFLAGKRTPDFARDARGEPLVMKKPFSLEAFTEAVLKHTGR